MLFRSRSVRALGGAWRRLLVLLAAGFGLSVGPVCAGEVPEPARQTPWTLHFQAGLNAVSERHLFWDLGEVVAPDSGFDADADWLEAYIKAGASREWPLDGGWRVFGKGSAVASYTLGVDAYDFGDGGKVTLEEAYLGLRRPAADGGRIEFSLGPRELRLGTGMLVANGGSSGFERGALKFGPRKAWERAALGVYARNHLTATVFRIDANERPATDGGNVLAGGDLRWDLAPGRFLGGTWLKVLRSGSPYVQAAAGGNGPPVIIDGARDGLEALNLYGRVAPAGEGNASWTLAFDLALERNASVDLHAWAGRLQLGYVFEHAWAPGLTYTFQTFSGDDPDTPRLERFDPLFYEGSPSAWATGSKSSMVFINSNVSSHGLALSVRPRASLGLTLRYAHIRAVALRSPIQFGQATRVETEGGTVNVVSGVTQAHLADDLFLENSLIINRNTFLTFGLSVSFPGEGIKRAIGGSVPNWTGGFVNVVVNY